MVSYEVERRILRRFDASIRNTPDERRKRRPLLRFAYANDRLTGMPVLGILYPSPSLADLGDPIPVSTDRATLEETLARARTRLKVPLRELTEPYLYAEREDESWYWAAPILLDLKRHSRSTRAWFGRWALQRLWSETKENANKESRWVDHVRHAKKLVDGSLELGRPPANLVEILSAISVAGPATSSLRALTRAAGPDARSALAARDAAARIAWSFRTLFNLPEAMALIRGERPRDEMPYWRQLVDYCVAGNLQAVLDEYVHMLRDLEGLSAYDDEEAWGKLTEAVTGALSLRTGAARVDEILTDDDTIWIEHRRLRNHFAMRFGDQELDDGRSGERAEKVRQAFNSPFWPFVLASTSVGQEGLDFHPYCHSVVHWNLPSNPVDLEQREGRVQRFKGHAVRKNIAAKHSVAALGSGSKDVWNALFEIASAESSGARGLVPYWLFPAWRRITRRALRSGSSSQSRRASEGSAQSISRRLPDGVWPAKAGRLGGISLGALQPRRTEANRAVMPQSITATREYLRIMTSPSGIWIWKGSARETCDGTKA